MVRSVVYICSYAEYRESAKDTSLCSLLDTFADSRDVFLRNSTADNGRSELECLFAVRIHRCEVYFTVTVLTTTTGLLRVLAVYINSLSHCLLVSYLRSTNVCLYLEFTKETVNDDLEVKLTHTGDDCLACFCICMNTECRILFSKLCKSLAHLILSGFCLRLDCDIDNRLWEYHGLKDYRMLLVTDCITSRCGLEANSCCDITGVNLVKLVSLVCMHLKNTANTLFFVFCCI